MRHYKELEFGDSAREKMVTGLNKLANAVRSTLGPKGRNVVIEKSFGAPLITKDGVTVAREIILKDQFENMGAALIKQVAAATNEGTGDGTTTGTVLAQAIVNEGMKSVAAGVSPIAIKRGIDKAVAFIVEELKNISKPCNTNTTITQVATISANSDVQSGELIAKAIEMVGESGVITIQEGRQFEDRLVVVDGMQFDQGFLSPYFITDQTTNSAVLKNPMIAILNNRINSLQELLPLLEFAKSNKSPLLLIAEDVEGEALSGLVVNHINGAIKVCAVKSPGFGEYKRGILEDIATIIGGEVIDSEISSITDAAIGFAKSVTVTKDKTVIVDGGGDPELIKVRVSILQEQMEAMESEYDKKKMKDRIAPLAGGVAVIHVGGATEVEMREKKDRLDDALNATRAAMDEGIIPGGGCVLAKLGLKLSSAKLNLDSEEDIGVSVIQKALSAPLRMISSNAGESADLVLSKVIENKSFSYGYNAKTNEYGDMIKMGVIDPAKVTRMALQNASSVAGLILTTEVMISLREEV